MQTSSSKSPGGKPIWWAVALSESIGQVKPLAAVFDGEELVLFRDSNGQPRALRDRCPHRRVPLSLGCVKGDKLQCGYHGWTFDGASGQCTAIPNLRGEEKVPAHYAAQAFAVAEGHGFVHVALGAWAADASPPELPTAGYPATGPEFTGSAVANISHAEYLAVMLDGPQCLLDFSFVRMTDFFLGDAQRSGDQLVLDRGAVWQSQVLPSQFVADYPLIVRTTVPLVGGSLRVELLTGTELPLVTVQIASGANRRGTTSVCWRGYVHTENLAGMPLRWRAGRAAGRDPFKLHAHIDGAAIAALLVAPSRELAAAQGSTQKIVPIRAVA